MDKQPECRSVDYFPSTFLCNLNSVAYGDQGIYSLLPSSGDYYSFCELGKLIDDPMGFPPDTQIAGCACDGNAGNVFPATDFKVTAS